MYWIIDYYKDAQGNEPVKEFLNSLSITARVKVMKLIDFLTERGVLLKEPYTRQVRGKIRELRVKDMQGGLSGFYTSPIQAGGLFSCMVLSKRLKRHLIERYRLQRKE